MQNAKDNTVALALTARKLGSVSLNYLTKLNKWRTKEVQVIFLNRNKSSKVLTLVSIDQWLYGQVLL